MKACQALAELVVIHTPPDPLFTEMHNGIKNNDDSAVRETMLQALRGIITPAGDKLTEPLRKQIQQTLVSMLGHPEYITRSCVAGCLVALCKFLPADQLEELFMNKILNEYFGDGLKLRHGRTVVLFVALKESPEIVYSDSQK